MRSFEVIPSEVNCLSSRLQPKWNGAALIPRAFICSPDDLVVVVAKVSRFDFVGRSFEQSIHIFATALKASRNHKALLSAKLNQVRLDGEPHNPGGFAFAAGAVSAFAEITKRQCLLLGIGFNLITISTLTVPALWGVSPIGDFTTQTPTPAPGLEAHQTDVELRSNHPSRESAKTSSRIYLGPRLNDAVWLAALVVSGDVDFRRLNDTFAL